LEITKPPLGRSGLTKWVQEKPRGGGGNKGVGRRGNPHQGPHNGRAGRGGPKAGGKKGRSGATMGKAPAAKKHAGRESKAPLPPPRDLGKKHPATHTTRALPGGEVTRGGRRRGEHIWGQGGKADRTQEKRGQHRHQGQGSPPQVMPGFREKSLRLRDWNRGGGKIFPTGGIQNFFREEKKSAATRAQGRTRQGPKFAAQNFLRSPPAPSVGIRGDAVSMQGEKSMLPAGRARGSHFGGGDPTHPPKAAIENGGGISRNRLQRPPGMKLPRRKTAQGSGPGRRPPGGVRKKKIPPKKVREKKNGKTPGEGASTRERENPGD